MNDREDYLFDDAINDLEVFFRKHITYNNELCRFIEYLNDCKEVQRIGFRFLHEELMAYRMRYSDYFTFSEKERKMIQDLFYFWG